MFHLKKKKQKESVNIAEILKRPDLEELVRKIDSLRVSARVQQLDGDPDLAREIYQEAHNLETCEVIFFRFICSLGYDYLFITRDLAEKIFTDHSWFNMISSLSSEELCKAFPGLKQKNNELYDIENYFFERIVLYSQRFSYGPNNGLRSFLKEESVDLFYNLCFIRQKKVNNPELVSKINAVLNRIDLKYEITYGLLYKKTE